MIKTKQELKGYIIKYATSNSPISTHAIYEHLNHLHRRRLLRRDLGYTRGTVARVLRGCPGVVFRDKMWRVNEVAGVKA
ncbi:hypothetical protein KO361_04380 [Candidatus Woesearchaeota archaeon]|jgi:hypothetical protein|nr:hypothetical protein [Candidatus Woesearchaeota archaeon]